MQRSRFILFSFLMLSGLFVLCPDAVNQQGDIISTSELFEAIVNKKSIEVDRRSLDAALARGNYNYVYDCVQSFSVNVANDDVWQAIYEQQPASKTFDDMAYILLRSDFFPSSNFLKRLEQGDINDQSIANWIQDHKDASEKNARWVAKMEKVERIFVELQAKKRKGSARKRIKAEKVEFRVSAVKTAFVLAVGGIALVLRKNKQ